MCMCFVVGLGGEGGGGGKSCCFSICFFAFCLLLFAFLFLVMLLLPWWWWCPPPAPPSPPIQFIGVLFNSIHPLITIVVLLFSCWFIFFLFSSAWCIYLVVCIHPVQYNCCIVVVGLLSLLLLLFSQA